MKKIVISIVVVVFFITRGSFAARAESNIEVALDATYAQRYVWRGLPLNDEAVLQPSLGLANGGFGLNVWANVDLTDWGEKVGYGNENGSATEIDYIGSYERSIGPASTVSLGFINYTFPQVGLPATTEVFIATAFDVAFAPSITVYIDEDGAEGANYWSFDIGHSFDVWESGDMSLAVGLAGHVAYTNEKYNETYWAAGFATTMDEYDDLDDASWSDYSISVAAPLALGGSFSVTPSYAYTSLMNRDLRDAIDDIGDPEIDPDNGVLTVTVSWSGEV